MPSNRNLMMSAAGAGLDGLIAALTDLNLTTGLKMAMDLGDSDCYVSGQTINDTSANGLDLFRGATSGSEASDPTFNGTPGGLSSNERLSFDGGDYCTLAVSNPTEINNMHKEGAQWTSFAWLYFPSITQNNFIHATAAFTTSVGCHLVVSSSSQLQIRVLGGGGVSSFLRLSTATVGTGAWVFLSGTIDENGGASASHIRINGTTETFNGSYSSPSSSDATYTFKVGRSDDTATNFESGVRLAMFGLYEGVALSTTETGNIFDETKGRFGL